MFLDGWVNDVDEGNAATRNCGNQEHVEGLPGELDRRKKKQVKRNIGPDGKRTG